MNIKLDTRDGASVVRLIEATADDVESIIAACERLDVEFKVWESALHHLEAEPKPLGKPRLIAFGVSSWFVIREFRIASSARDRVAPVIKAASDDYKRKTLAAYGGAKES